METVTLVTKRRKNRKPRPRKSTRVTTVRRTTIKKRRPRRSKKTSGLTRELVELSSLISNPCHGPLVRAMGTGSVVERVRSTISPNAVASNNCGYLIWFPDYHCAGGSVNVANLFLYSTSNPTVVPTNTIANPLGTAAVDTTGLFYPDPASTLLGSAAFSRGQTLSACMQLDYLGQLSSAAGQVAIIKNFPFKALATSDTSSTIVAPSVDQLFAYAAERERFQVTGHEAIYRPSDQNSILRTDGLASANASVAQNADAPITVGGPAVNTTFSNFISSNSTYGVCIAWKGIAAIANNIQLNCIKVVSLELAPSGFAIEPTFVGSHDSGYGSTPIDTATSILDENVPWWQSHAVNTGVKVAGKLAKFYTENIGVSRVRQSVMGSNLSIMDR